MGGHANSSTINKYANFKRCKTCIRSLITPCSMHASIYEDNIISKLKFRSCAVRGEIRNCNWKMDPTRRPGCVAPKLCFRGLSSVAASHHTLGSLYQASSYFRRCTKIKYLSSIESFLSFEPEYNYRKRCENLLPDSHTPGKPPE